MGTAVGGLRWTRASRFGGSLTGLLLAIVRRQTLTRSSQPRSASSRRIGLCLLICLFG